eukprot:CAMPEP_0195132886 /NCGR_PEP_ID=MMETSP0448-20130528/147744_1 /TAXON_ID=66468 /ORGANISM="Heterocapsa triquestra, Strain CCMP 448" /LENGTH=282 /DNA_ID=CAMNT_0040170915 /DNA_START=111 /DNA_END=957 /DNA_ORIENTATION=-
MHGSDAHAKDVDAHLLEDVDGDVEPWEAPPLTEVAILEANHALYQRQHHCGAQQQARSTHRLVCRPLLGSPCNHHQARGDARCKEDSGRLHNEECPDASILLQRVRQSGNRADQGCLSEQYYGSTDPLADQQIVDHVAELGERQQCVAHDSDHRGGEDMPLERKVRSKSQGVHPAGQGVDGKNLGAIAILQTLIHQQGPSDRNGRQHAPELADGVADQVVGLRVVPGRRQRTPEARIAAHGLGVTNPAVQGVEEAPVTAVTAAATAATSAPVSGAFDGAVRG